MSTSVEARPVLVQPRSTPVHSFMDYYENNSNWRPGTTSVRYGTESNCNTNKTYVLIADVQALTDNFETPEKVRDNIITMY